MLLVACDEWLVGGCRKIESNETVWRAVPSSASANLCPLRPNDGRIGQLIYIKGSHRASQ
jgi:hypothetical protein